jgi:ribosomal protein S13
LVIAREIDPHASRPKLERSGTPRTAASTRLRPARPRRSHVEPLLGPRIEKYLGSGLVRGVGKVMAERIVRHFGMETLEVIDQKAARLTEVEGIGPVRSERITTAWVEQRQIKDVMVFLQSHGVSTAYATRIYKQYRDRSIAVVRENPYRLAIDILGIGFKSADKIASQLGIGPTSPLRAEAGVLHVLATLSDEGHVYVPRPRLLSAAAEILTIDPPIIEKAIGDLAAEERIVIEPPPSGDEAVYLQEPAHGRDCERGPRPVASRDRDPPDQHRHRAGDHLVRGAAEDHARRGA